MIELAGGTLIGTAVLWGIDNHNRSANVGLGLLPNSRGKGYGTDVVAVLCHYGFVREGVLRSSAWVMGEFLDSVVLGLLVEEWKDVRRQK